MIKKHEITKKRHLEILLQNILPHNKPKVRLEQYTTPANIAADILWNAYSLGDIEYKKVVDMGCGTGVFAIGAALMGARKVVGIDIDSEAIDVANGNASDFGVDNSIEFISGDVNDFVYKADTVIQNPPFGAQKAGTKNADRIFMKKSIEIAPIIYSFHMQDTEEFVEKFYNSLGGQVTYKFYYNFPIPKIYDFHQKNNINVNVVVLRIEKNI